MTTFFTGGANRSERQRLIRRYMEQYSWSDGGASTCRCTGATQSREVYWLARNDVVMAVAQFDPAVSTIEIGFSWDMSPAEVARFCARFEADVGPWEASAETLIAVGDPTTPSGRVLWGIDAYTYKLYRDQGLVKENN